MAQLTEAGLDEIADQLADTLNEPEPVFICRYCTTEIPNKEVSVDGRDFEADCPDCGEYNHYYIH